MDQSIENVESARALASCIRELAALGTLPHLWIGQEPRSIVENLLDVLVTAIRLDFAYVRLDDPPFEAARPREHVATLAAAFATEASTGPRSLPEAVGGPVVSVFAERLRHVSGVLCVGSKRPDFPLWSESVLLSAVASQTALWTVVSRQLLDSRRIAAKLAESESYQTQLAEENAYLREEVTAALALAGIVGRSPALGRNLEQVEAVAPADVPVLLSGEAGTGKELLAREIHARSLRAKRPLIRIDCAAPHGLESDFFARLKLADRTTVLFESIADLPLELQGALSRILHDGQYVRPGDEVGHPLDVRVLATTKRDLHDAVCAGRFREDLYARLGTSLIRVVPLRERKEDIPLLAKHFVALTARRMGTPASDLSEAQFAALEAYDWPGNVRELENVIERAVILARGGELRPDRVLLRSAEEDWATVSPARASEVLRDEEIRRRERANLVAALAKSSGRIYGTGGAADLLGLKPSTLQSRLRALGIRPRERPPL